MDLQIKLVIYNKAKRRFGELYGERGKYPNLCFQKVIKEYSLGRELYTKLYEEFNLYGKAALPGTKEGELLDKAENLIANKSEKIDFEKFCSEFSEKNSLTQFPGIRKKIKELVELRNLEIEKNGCVQ